MRLLDLGGDDYNLGHRRRRGPAGRHEDSIASALSRPAPAPRLVRPAWPITRRVQRGGWSGWWALCVACGLELSVCEDEGTRSDCEILVQTHADVCRGRR